MVRLCSPFFACRSQTRLEAITTNESLAYHGNFSQNTDSGQLEAWTPDTTFWVEYLSICLLGNLVVFVGLLGNAFNLVILSRTGVGKDTTNMLLLFLAVVDVFVIIFHFLQFTPCFTCYLDETDVTTANTIIYLHSTFYSLNFCNLSVMTTGIIALERATAVYFPFKVSSIFTRKTVKIVLSVMIVCFVIFSASLHIGLRFTWTLDPELNETVASSFYFIFDYDDYIIGIKWVENITLTVGMGMVCTCGCATAIKLVQQSKDRKEMTSNSSLATSDKNRKVVKMLLTICLFSFVGNIPNILSNLMTAYYDKEFKRNGWYCFTRGMVLLVIVSNSSVNFFIYFFMSSKFQKAYKELFRNSKCVSCLKGWKLSVERAWQKRAGGNCCPT